MTDDFSKLTENIIYCHKNKLLKDEVGQAIFQIWRYGVCDDNIALMFERRVSNHKLKLAFSDFMNFQIPKLTRGDFVIGLDEKGKELRSYIQFLNANILTVASAGAGKTTLSYFWNLQIAPHIQGMWLFDMRKREFAVLKPYLARLGVELIILPGRSLKINPLQLPIGVEVSDWVPRVADMLIEVLGLAPRASKLLQTKLHILYRKFEGKNLYPTLYDVFDEIKKDKNSNHAARTAILDSLEPVLLSLGPEVLAYRHGWTTEELAKKHICFELAGLSETDKNLILNSLILSEFTSRISRGISNPKICLYIAIDEAQKICSSSSQASAIGSQIGLVRGTGIGVGLSIQSMNGVLPQVVSNTASKILGRCGSMADYAAAGHSMGLNAEQIRWAQMNLEPGLFICQLSEGQWRYPFVLRIPPMNLTKDDDSQESGIGTLSKIPTVCAPEFDRWGLVPEVSVDAIKSSMFDSEQEFSFCKAVADNPMQASSVYPKAARISSKTAKKVRQQLIAKSFIGEHTLDTGGRGRSSILLEVLPEGIKAIAEHQEAQI